MSRPEGSCWAFPASLPWCSSSASSSFPRAPAGSSRRAAAKRLVEFSAGSEEARASNGSSTPSDPASRRRRRRLMAAEVRGKTREGSWAMFASEMLKCCWLAAFSRQYRLLEDHPPRPHPPRSDRRLRPPNVSAAVWDKHCHVCRPWTL